MSKNTVVATFGPKSSLCPRQPAILTMRQRGRDNFSVQYGRQFSEALNYAEAAREFGECVMHHQACEGILDNSYKGNPA